jgi:hypothetical protein
MQRRLTFDFSPVTFITTFFIKVKSSDRTSLLISVINDNVLVIPSSCYHHIKVTVPENRLNQIIPTL